MASDKIESATTILLVEDEKEFCSFLLGLLTDNGYNVLCADSAKQAIQHSQDFRGKIHMMLSNVKLGQENGVELATRLTRQRPDMKVMLVSGYAFGTIVLDHGWHFLPRPFTASMMKQLIEARLRDPNQHFHGPGGSS